MAQGHGVLANQTLSEADQLLHGFRQLADETGMERDIRSHRMGSDEREPRAEVVGVDETHDLRIVREAAGAFALRRETEPLETDEHIGLQWEVDRFRGGELFGEARVIAHSGNRAEGERTDQGERREKPGERP